MRHSLTSIGLLAAVTASTVCSPACANYYLGTLSNRTNQPLSVASVVPGGASIVRAGLGRNGYQLAIVVPKSGVVVIYEDGSKCPGFSWAAKIEYGNQKWGFGYEGDGIINVTVNADATVTIGGTGTPGGNGRVFPGGC